MTRATDVETLVRVSRMYYELGETQDEIANALGTTRPQVSRLLKRARAEGIVEIRVVDRSTRPGEVASELEYRFGMRAVHLAPTFAGSDDLTRRRVGRLAAQVLVGAIRDGMVVGIGDGSALAATADGLDDVASPVATTIVPLCGGFWGTGGGREPYRRIAEALGASAIGLLAPGLLDDALTRDALAAHTGIREVTALWDRLDVAILGIGGPAWSEALVGGDLLVEIEEQRAVGEMLIAPFDIDGRFVAEGLRARTIACDARHLNAVPVTIGVASGAAKVEPILGALRSGAISVLVTDLDTAERVLDFDTARPVAAAVPRALA